MATRDLRITTDWVQLTDGTADIMIQVMAGSIYLRDAPTQPLASDQGHLVASWIGVTSPQVAWVRAVSGSSYIVVT